LGAATRLDVDDQDSHREVGIVAVCRHGGSLNADAGHAHAVAPNLEQVPGTGIFGDGQEGPGRNGCPGTAERQPFNTTPSLIRMVGRPVRSRSALTITVVFGVPTARTNMDTISDDVIATRFRVG
jgi:hypothetical protein